MQKAAPQRSGCRFSPGWQRPTFAAEARRRRDLGTGASPQRLLVELRGLDEPGSALFAKPIAVAADGQHMAVMQQAIEDCHCDYRIAKYGTPFADRAIAGKQDAAALIAPRD